MSLLPSAKAPKWIYLSVPHMSGREIPYVMEAFDTNWLTCVGKNIEEAEALVQKRLGGHAVALASGTAAIHLALRVIGVKAGDEVACSDLTFAGSCNPIVYEHAKPIFIDSDYISWNIDPNLVADFLKKRAHTNKLPKALIVVHLFGQSADLDPILETCAQYDVKVIEDAAEALGTTYKGRPVGTIADAGVLSFNGNKIITCTGGGMFVSTRKNHADKVRFWSTQARDPGLNYMHSELGYNYRMSNVLAGILLGQLETLDERVNQRRAIAFRYRDALADIPGLQLMPQADYGLHTNWLTCFLIDAQKFGLTQIQLIDFLKHDNIESRPVWKPMHTQKLYAHAECIGGAVAEDINARGICLPSSSSLSLEDQQFIIETIREAHQLAKDRARFGES
ncbi:MAG TPA: DegT/DnrJ/EryC1/StrS family aminotransferase [Verrucomicrobiae bacterium]